ncbi:hypothetical protein KAU19_00280 [Candidatus Parcubacteria bacterium]|nr:hypothetical protein [Candidatus Parcubacteria bacterium]
MYINTTQGDDIIIVIKDSDKIVMQKKIKAKYSQAEKLLPMIDKMLAQNNLKIKDIQKIKVANVDGSFTALRIGVVTANALGYALGVPVQNIVENKKFKVKSRKFDFDIVEPVYSKEPNITKKITDSR